ncbi:MAG: leucine-rich repeat protein [Clostridiales bacterium]|nr:leucine-rich repeat protein [Clostridiales bacterium]
MDDVALSDPDNDGLDNLTEYEYGTDPLNPDTDGDNVYDKIELLKGLDPLKEKTDGETDDYIRAYGQPDLELTDIYCDDMYMYFSVKNDTDSIAMRSVVEVGSGEESIALWTVNVDAHSIIDFAVKKEDLVGISSFNITADAGEITCDSDYTNNSFSYSAEQSVRLDDIDVVKNTSASLLPAAQNSANDIYHWMIDSGDCITLNDKTGEITAAKIGRSRVKVETLSGVSKTIQISVVSFEGAEFTVFESKKINDNTAIAVTGYFGEDVEAHIPETIGGLPVTTINANVFRNSAVKTVILPHTIEFIAENAFITNHSISEFIVAVSNESFASENGVLYNKCKTKLIAYPPAKNNTLFNIPDEVAIIEKNAFYRCSNLQQIFLGLNIENVGIGAFSNCLALEEVHFAGSLDEWCKISFGGTTANPCYYAHKLYADSKPVAGYINISTDVSDYALYGLTEITNIHLEDSVSKIGNYAFYGQSNLESINIPNGVEEIGSYAFNCCTALESIIIPGSVKRIGVSAFRSCVQLESIEIKEGVTNIGSSSFSECSALKTVIIPNSVTAIGLSAFYNCNSLENLTIPFVGTSKNATGTNRVFGAIFGTTIYSTAEGITTQYYDPSFCTYYFIPDSIQTVTVTDASSIPYGAFYNCSFIKNIEISNTSESIGEKAFAGCSSLESLTIPFVGASRAATGEEGVLGYYFKTADVSSEDTTTQYYAGLSCKFYYIPSTLEAVIITDGTQLSYGAFYNCSNLKTIGFNKELTSIATAVFKGCSALSSVQYAGAMEDWCSIDFASETSTPCNYATSIFINGESIEGVLHIPNGLTEIKKYTFYGFNTVTDLIFPESVSVIGSNAFCQCTGLTNVQLPDTIIKINSGAFMRCSALSAIVLPDTIDTIAMETFSCCTSLSRIIIPDGVTYIGTEAFYQCTALKEVVLPNSICKIASQTFNRCTELEKVNYTGDIYQWCSTIFMDSYSNPMRYATELYIRDTRIAGDLIIPADLNIVNNYAFYGCSELESVHFGGTLDEWCSISFGGATANPCYYAHKLYVNNEPVAGIINISTDISNYAMYAVTDVTGLVLAGSVSKIGNYAFCNCKDMESITIPNTVTVIGNNAFSGCSVLKNITIPGSVASLGNSAFSNCSGLESITIQEGVSNIGSSSFSGCSALKAIIIPNSVTNIGLAAFRNCSSLESLSIPFIGTSREATGSSRVFGFIFGNTGIKDADGVTEQHFDVSSVSYYYIPSSLKSVTVTDATSVPYGAFYNCANLESITLSNSISSIGENAFYSCVNLENMTFEAGSSLATIGNMAFANCSSLTVLYLPASLTLVDRYAFNNCSGISDVYYDGADSEVISTLNTIFGASNVHFFVARVNDTQFYSFSDAVTAAVNTGTIELLGNIAESYKIAKNQVLKVKTNGYSLNITAPSGLNVFSITDSNGVTTYGVPYFHGQTLSTTGEIACNFYVSLPAGSENLLTVKANTTAGNTEKEYIYTTDNMAKRSSYYIASVGVAAKDMGNIITAQILDESGTVYARINYSVKQYCINAIKNNKDDASRASFVNFAASILNYGAYAQQQFNVNTNNLVNTELKNYKDTNGNALFATDLSNAAVKDDAWKATGGTGNNNYVTFVGQTVSTTSNTQISYYLKLSDSIENYTFSVTKAGTTTTKAISVREISGSSQYNCVVTILDIPAKNLGDVYTLAVTNGDETAEKNYSVLTYIYNQYDKGGTLGNMVRAMYLYYAAAAEYFS